MSARRLTMEAERQRTRARLNDLARYRELSDPEREFIARAGARHRLTFQELQRISTHARDLEMWDQAGIESLWTECERELPDGLAGRPRKKKLLGLIDARVNRLRAMPTAYPEAGLPTPKREKLEIVSRASDRAIFGDCPVASEESPPDCGRRPPRPIARKCNLSHNDCGPDRPSYWR